MGGGGFQRAGLVEDFGAVLGGEVEGGFQGDGVGAHTGQVEVLRRQRLLRFPRQHRFASGQDDHAVHLLQLGHGQHHRPIGQRPLRPRQIPVLLGKIQRQHLVLQLVAEQSGALGEGGGQVHALRLGQQGVYQLLDDLLFAVQRVGLRVQRTAGGVAVGQEVEVIVLLVGGSGFELAGPIDGQQEQHPQGDTEQPFLHVGSSRASGSVTWKQAPPALPSVRRMEPPACKTVSWTMDSPSPVPPASRERALSTR